MAKLKVGDVVTGLILSKMYDANALDILLPRFVEFQWERKKGERKKYKVLAELPTEQEYKDLKVLKYTSTVADLVASAFSDVEGLADELDEAYENMPENLKSTDLADRRQEAASACRDVNQPDLPDLASEIKVYHASSSNVGSRSERAAEASAMLNAAADALRNHATDIEATNFDLSQELESCADDLQNSADEIDGIEFPGMYS